MAKMTKLFFMAGVTKLFFVDIRRVFFTAMFVCFTILVIGQDGNSGELIKPDPDLYPARVPGQALVDSDTSKWHPAMFYIVYPDLRITFKLPYEKDRSGVANLLFKNKETGSIHLLDTVKNNIRYYNRLNGKYDVILLYNNGKYIRRNDVFFYE